MRSYVLTSVAHGCTQYRTKLVYLVIDALEMSDAGNYTCYASSNAGQAVTSYQVEIAPGKPLKAISVYLHNISLDTLV